MFVLIHKFLRTQWLRILFHDLTDHFHWLVKELLLLNVLLLSIQLSLMMQMSLLLLYCGWIVLNALNQSQGLLLFDIVNNFELLLRINLRENLSHLILLDYF